MLSPLNYFAPYPDLAGRHENQLTRALLVVLGFSPLAHSTWLRRVDTSLRLESLPAAVCRTQESKLVSSGTGDGEDEPPVRVISVLLAPDAQPIAATVQASERNQVLDGIVEYGRDLVIVLENKIIQGVHDRQVVQINTRGANVRLDEAARAIPWQELLADFADLVTRELVFGAEKKLLEQFLEFVDHHFPKIGPYSTLRRAGGQPDRVKRRLESVIAQAVGVYERPNQSIGWQDLPERPDRAKRAVEMAFLGLDSFGNVVLRMTPADTLVQSRVLYARADCVRSLLQMKLWRLQPNFHWGAIHQGKCWTRGNITPKAYVEYWVKHIGTTQAVKRDDWPAIWARFEAEGIVSAEDKLAFDDAFTRTRIQLATPRPGLEMDTTWTAVQAQQLDDSGQLVVAVRGRVCELLETLGESGIIDEIQTRAGASAA